MGAVELPKLTGADYSGEGIPDRSDTIVDLVAKGDRIAMVFHIKGTHTGTPAGVGPVVPGDVIVVRIEGLTDLVTTIGDPA